MIVSKKQKKHAENGTQLIQTALRLPKDTHKRLKLIAVKKDKSLQNLYTEAIDYILKKYKDV